MRAVVTPLQSALCQYFPRISQGRYLLTHQQLSGDNDSWEFDMTLEERMDRVEHLSATMFEEWREERKLDRQLWRDTQRQIEESQRRIEEWGKQTREADDRLGKLIGELATESRLADAELSKRIDDMVSAMGELLKRLGK